MTLVSETKPGRHLATLRRCLCEMTTPSPPDALVCWVTSLEHAWQHTGCVTALVADGDVSWLSRGSAYRGGVFPPSGPQAPGPHSLGF